MKNKKGFTLVELLAVIVILAIIAVIATPIVLNMITKARKNAARTSALGYVDAIEYNNGFADVDQPGYTKITGTKQVSELSEIKLKGKRPSSGTVTISDKGKVISAELCINGYTVTYENREATVGDKCGGESTPTTKTYNPGDIVYFDPVANDKCSTFNVDNIKAGTSTCYKWRVITVDDTTSATEITLQMDHNLVNTSAWVLKSDYNDDTNYGTYGNTNKGPITALKVLETATSGWNNALKITYSYDTTLNGTNTGYNYGILSCTTGSCKVGNGENFTTNLKARIITGEEVRSLTLNAGAVSGTLADNWTLASSTSNLYYFSSSEKALGTNDDVVSGETGSTSLVWLVENTGELTKSGASANIYGDANNGYWTLSPNSGKRSSAWFVNFYGNFNGSLVYNENSYGIRPVITIDKSTLQ